jgi:flagellar L-ring protein precursor FlgH
MKSFVRKIWWYDRALAIVVLVGMACGCSPKVTAPKVIPSLDYADSVRSEPPTVRWVDGMTVPDSPAVAKQQGPLDSEMADVRAGIDFRESGHSPSLWRESSGKGGIFHDFRAWKPMDLITIVVSEISEGKKEADTNIIDQNSFVAAISNFLGFEKYVPENISEVDPTALINATTKNQFRGQGATVRKGTLKGTISAMVQEVLPSGVLRIEGKKIISVNNEEQVMVISGLVRVRDIDSFNSVKSSQIANMRIDYFGNGVVNGVQGPGIVNQILHMVWPF